jgi:ABC-2 type transport system permease protein
MKVIDLALKDLLRSTRNLFLIGMAVAAPLLISALIWFSFGAMGGDEPALAPVRVGMVNGDELPAGAPLEDSLGSLIGAMLRDPSVSDWLLVSDYASEEAARAALNAQELGVAVIVPAGFTGAYLGGERPAPIAIMQDPTLSVGPAVVREMVTGLLDGVAGGGVAYATLSGHVPSNALPGLLDRYGTWYADYQRALAHDPASAALAVRSPGQTGGDIATPLATIIALVMVGQVIFFAFYTGAYAMISLLQESEEGTLARLFTTPTPRATILAGKFVAVFLVVLLQGLVLLAAGRVMFGINWGQPAAVALALVGQVAAAVGLGVLLISLIRSTNQGGIILGGALTALGMLSGLFTTNVPMPAGFQALAQFTPQGRVLGAWKLAIAGEPAAGLLVPVLILAAMGAAMFAVGAQVFRRRFS